MELSQYVESVQEQLARTAALADDRAQEVAQQLGSSLDSALRLALIQALSDAAAEISNQTGDRIEVRMSGQGPEFVISAGEPTESDVEAGEEAYDPEEPQARISLRLPQPLKNRIDELAATEGVSVNTWLTRNAMRGVRRANRPGRGPWGPGGPGPWGPGGPGPWGPPGGPGGRRRGGRGPWGPPGGGRRGGPRGFTE